MSHAITRPADITVPATSLWARMPLIAGVVGLLGTGFTIAMMFGEHKDRAFFAYLFAFLFVLTIALGSLIFVLIQHAVRAGWSAVLRRIAEASAATLPLFILLFLPIALLGMGALYPWTHETDLILERKAWWLGVFDAQGQHRSLMPFGVRATIFFACWAIVSQLLFRWSVQQDSVAVSDTVTRDAITKRLWTLSAAGIFLYALSQSFAAIDWLMSLQPHWYSTMFGVYFFAGSMVGFYAFITLVAMSLQRNGMLKTAITTEHYHDLGKFQFGHIVFWAYVTFCQFMLIWYANIPEETEFYMQRMEGGWSKITLALPFLHFFIPFFMLLSRHVKRSRLGLTITSVWLLVVHAIDLYWNILPNYGAHGAHNAAADAGAAHGAGAIVAAHPHFAIALVDITAVLGVGGLFLAVFAYLLKKNSVVAINDPRLIESLGHENY